MAGPLQIFSPYAAPPPAEPGYAASPTAASDSSQQPNYAYVPPQQHDAAAPAAYATTQFTPGRSYPASSQGYAPPPRGGRGFLQDIFGGPRIPAPASQVFAPATPDYAAPQSASIEPSSAQPGPGDASSYPIDPQFLPQTVDYQTDEKAGTIVIDTPNKFLYLVQDDGKALRYGIGVGRPGFTWSGVKEITAKKEWPDWRPPDDMLQRRPDLPRFMPGGADNPLGARAMYLGSTLYRIHGSNEPWTIGTNVSSGCIRMRNEDVTDLYNRVKVGTKVVVI
jgi:lipoprotein-anchoring transpeptidase ErfK/SrfK